MKVAQSDSEGIKQSYLDTLVWGILMTLLVTACLLSGGITKEHFFLGEIVALACCDLPRRIPWSH